MTEQKLFKYGLTVSAVILAILFSAQLVTAQNTFDGKYSLSGSVSGTARFDYYIQDNDTIFNGPFRFHSVLTENDEGKLMGTEFSGNYFEGGKSGNWIYRHKTVQREDKATIEGLELVQKISGEELIVSGDFVNALPSGNWRLTRRLIENSTASDTLVFVSSNFVDGTITGSIQGEVYSRKFTGNFDESGRLDGNWKIVHPIDDNVELIELRSFNNGIFTSHGFELLNEQFEVQYAGLDQSVDSNETWVEVPFREKNLNHLIYIIQALSKPEGVIIPGELESGRLKALISETNEMLSQALESFHAKSGISIWQYPENTDVAMNSGTIYVREFELTSKQRQQLRESRNKSRDAERIVTNFFEDPQIDIGKHSFRELNYFSAVFEVYFENLRKLANTVEVISNPSFRFVDLQSAFQAIRPNIEFPDSVSVRYKDKAFRQSYHIPQVEPDQHPIVVLHEYISQMHREITVIEEQVGNIVAKYKKQSQLTENEERLVDKRDSIVDFFRGNINQRGYNEFHEELSDSIVTKVNLWFEEYAELNLENKLIRLDELLDCFDQFLILYKQVERIPVRLSDIDEMYTRTVWNPYTYTDMDERVKERLYRVYENELLPLLWSELKNHLSCDKMTGKGKNYEKLYHRMLELREQDTKKLEKELRRPENLQQILSLISLSLDIETK